MDSDNAQDVSASLSPSSSPSVSMPATIPHCSAPACRSLHARCLRLENRVADLTARHLQVRQALAEKVAQHQQAEQALRETEHKLQLLLAHQERMREDEHKRIALAIHDEQGQNLMALRIDISALHARTAESHPRLHAWTGAALDNTDAAIKSVRAVINELRPFELELGLQAAIAWQLNMFQSRSGIACELNIADSAFDSDIDDRHKLAIFRILQEALSNIKRHARASQASVALSRRAGVLQMTVQDNGVGAPPAPAPEGTAFGLIGIQERLAQLGGDLSIESSPGRGWALSIAVPVEEAAVEAAVSA